ncbi:MAG: pyridoxal phosphate-dependent aminotransferase [Acidobacteriota bacterium]
MPPVSSRAASISLPPFDVLNNMAAARRAAGRDVITLGQGVPSFAPPPAALEAARAALPLAATHLYCADAGLLSLREALCEQLGAYHGITATPDDLIITAGGNQAFMLAATTLLDPGDEVVLAAPYFVNHEMALRAVGAIPIEAGTTEAEGFRTSWRSLEPHLTARTRAVVLCTPSNPTGAVIAPAELGRIIAELSARHIRVMCDETYMHFVYDGPRGPSAAAAAGWRDHVVVLGTFSKSFGMTGWRLGFLLAGADICEHAIKIQDAMIICAPVIAQIAAEAAVRESWTHSYAYHDEMRARRRVLAEELATIPALHWTPTEGGFFAFVRVEGCTDSTALATAILDAVDVVTIPGATFGRSGEGYLRLSYGAAGEATLHEACARLRTYFASLKTN